jgi:hypothetical protein
MPSPRVNPFSWVGVVSILASKSINTLYPFTEPVAAIDWAALIES